jgi:hypothetical protein
MRHDRVHILVVKAFDPGVSHAPDFRFVSYALGCHE